MKYICKNLKEVEQIANHKGYDKELLNSILKSIKNAINNNPIEKDYIQITFNKFDNNLDHGETKKETMMFCVGKCSSCRSIIVCDDINMEEVNVNQMFRELKIKRILKEE